MANLLEVLQEEQADDGHRFVVVVGGLRGVFNAFIREEDADRFQDVIDKLGHSNVLTCTCAADCPKILT